MGAIEKIVVVTKKTPLEELIERFNSRTQAKFYLEHLGASFQEYEQEHDTYHRAVDLLRQSLPRDPQAHVIERSFLPTFTFGARDLVITIGQDGLVVNVAKYLTTQPILALNPDPARIDGVLIPFLVPQLKRLLPAVLEGRMQLKRISMAEAELSDGQRLFAVNDLFIGPKSHISAKYVLDFQGHREPQSSSGIIVSTGTGSTGWVQSIVTGAAHVTHGVLEQEVKLPALTQYRLDAEADELYFTVREPFTSKTSKATVVFGCIEAGEFLYLTSQMPGYGVIFSVSSTSPMRPKSCSASSSSWLAKAILSSLTCSGVSWASTPRTLPSSVSRAT